jgi:hypothetical protein
MWHGLLHDTFITSADIRQWDKMYKQKKGDRDDLTMARYTERAEMRIEDRTKVIDLVMVQERKGINRYQKQLFQGWCEGKHNTKAN